MALYILLQNSEPIKCQFPEIEKPDICPLKKFIQGYGVHFVFQLYSNSKAGENNIFVRGITSQIHNLLIMKGFQIITNLLYPRFQHIYKSECKSQLTKPLGIALTIYAISYLLIYSSDGYLFSMLQRDFWYLLLIDLYLSVSLIQENNSEPIIIEDEHESCPGHGKDMSDHIFQTTHHQSDLAEPTAPTDEQPRMELIEEHEQDNNPTDPDPAPTSNP